MRNKFLGWYKLNGERTIINVLLLFGLFVFIKPILLTTKDYLLVTSDIITDVFVISISLALPFWGWQFDIKAIGRFANRIVTTLIFVTYYVFILREIPELQPALFSFSEGFYYFDLIVILGAISWTIVPIIRFLHEKDQLRKSLEDDKPKKIEPKDIDSFIEDIPTENEDELQRESYAKTLANKILKTTPKRAFNIGIFGEWGSGKSDFIHRIAKALKDQNNKEVIIVEFNPWRVGSNSSITEDYLQVLSRHLRPYSSRLSNSIGDYAKQFIDKADTTGLVKSASNILTDTFMPNADIESQYEAIKNEVSYLNTTIVVFIDDLDRLNKEEILETFKLIRNVADFPNTFFVLGLDYGYVMKTAFDLPLGQKLTDVVSVEKDFNSDLDQRKIAVPTLNSLLDSRTVSLDALISGKYIDKIFQLKISIPTVSENYISRLTIQLFEPLFLKHKISIDLVRLNSIISYVEKSQFFNFNLRNIKHLYNSYNLKILYLSSKKINIDHLDLLVLTIIECFDYNSYLSVIGKRYFTYLTTIDEQISENISEYISHEDYKKKLTLISQELFSRQIRDSSGFKMINDCILLVNHNNSYSFSSPFSFCLYTSLSSFGDIDFNELYQIISSEYDESLILNFRDSSTLKFASERDFKKVFLNYLMGDFNAFFIKSNPDIFLKSCMVMSDFGFLTYELNNYLQSYLQLKNDLSDGQMALRIKVLYYEFKLITGYKSKSRVIESFSQLIRVYLNEDFYIAFGVSVDIYNISIELIELMIENKSPINIIEGIVFYCNAAWFKIDILSSKVDYVQSLHRAIYFLSLYNTSHLLHQQFLSFDTFVNHLDLDNLKERYAYFIDLFEGFEKFKSFLSQNRNNSELPVIEFTYNLIKGVESIEEIGSDFKATDLENLFKSWAKRK